MNPMLRKILIQEDTYSLILAMSSTPEISDAFSSSKYAGRVAAGMVSPKVVKGSKKEPKWLSNDRGRVARESTFVIFKTEKLEYMFETFQENSFLSVIHVYTWLETFWEHCYIKNYIVGVILEN